MRVLNWGPVPAEGFRVSPRRKAALERGHREMRNPVGFPGVFQEFQPARSKSHKVTAGPAPQSFGLFQNSSWEQRAVTTVCHRITVPR